MNEISNKYYWEKLNKILIRLIKEGLILKEEIITDIKKKNNSISKLKYIKINFERFRRKYNEYPNKKIYNELNNALWFLERLIQTNKINSNKSSIIFTKPNIISENDTEMSNYTNFFKEMDLKLFNNVIATPPNSPNLRSYNYDKKLKYKLDKLIFNLKKDKENRSNNINKKVIIQNYKLFEGASGIIIDYNKELEHYLVHLPLRKNSKKFFKPENIKFIN